MKVCARACPAATLPASNTSRSNLIRGPSEEVAGVGPAAGGAGWSAKTEPVKAKTAARAQTIERIVCFIENIPAGSMAEARRLEKPNLLACETCARWSNGTMSHSAAEPQTDRSADIPVR